MKNNRMIGFCFVVPIICLNKPNTGKDGSGGYHIDDDDNGDSDDYYAANIQ
jgi:hypothetical protein